MNGYPKSIVFREIRKFISNTTNPPQKPDTAPKRKLYASLPYFGPQSEKLKLELTKIIGDHFPQLDLGIALINGRTISSFFQYKDKLPFSLKSNVIYYYSCAQCASATYIGSTMRCAYVRLAEHRGRSHITDKLLKSPHPSAIRVHAIATGHPVKDENFCILDQASNSKHDAHLRLLESLHIGQKKPSLNNAKSSFPFHSSRLPLGNQYRQF